MKISSYNITDVAYHYIGLRVLAGLPATARREDQTSAISRSVLKYVSDKALRLLLPEPTGTFETVGEKICQELVHFKFAQSVPRAYELTEDGRKALELLDNRNHVELRRLMARVHLQTYDNLRAVVRKYFEIESLWLPVVEASQLTSQDYIQHLLKPTFKEDAPEVATEILESLQSRSPKKVEDALRQRILRQMMPDMNLSLFRALSDRLVSLRLLNIMKASAEGCEFARSYSPCVAASPPYKWYVKLDVLLSSGDTFIIYLCEPDMGDKNTQENLLIALNAAFSALSPQAGYYDLPEVRDFVCYYLKIPEASFDEGINHLLDLQPSPLTAGLRYDGISGRRKPLVRSQEVSQIHNLIRRT